MQASLSPSFSSFSTVEILFFAEYLPFFEPEFTLRPDLPKRADNHNTKEVAVLLKADQFSKTSVSVSFCHSPRDY